MVPSSSTAIVMAAESAVKANDITARSSLSVRARGAPPAAGTVKRRSCMYALYFGSSPCRYAIWIPSGLHASFWVFGAKGRARFRGIDPVRASMTSMSSRPS